MGESMGDKAGANQCQGGAAIPWGNQVHPKQIWRAIELENSVASKALSVGSPLPMARCPGAFAGEGLGAVGDGDAGGAGG